MGVNINMEMPKNCGECRMHFLGDPDYVCCSITNRIPKIVAKYNNSKIDLDARKKSIMAVQRPDWCPLIEVPEPHGDLIERETIHELVNWTSIKPPFSRKQVRRFIDNAPTIIPASEEGET